MKAIDFPGTNVVFAKDQPEYQPLPAMVFEDGQVVTLWQLTPEEIETVVKTGQIYISVLTFNQPLQPIMPFVEQDELENITKTETTNG